MSIELIADKVNKAGQDHLLTFYNTLSPTEQQELVHQIDNLDFERVDKILKLALEVEKQPPADNSFTPPPTESVKSVASAEQHSWYERGLDAIANNKLAVILMAGGQGTRLGSSNPKGMYDVGLLSHKTLFELQAQRIAKVEELAAQKSGKDADQVNILWFVMTSGPTRATTEAFFKENKYFGLKEKNVIFFEQGVLPCLTEDGKVILGNKGNVAVAPDGNGGVYTALHNKKSISPTSTKSPIDILTENGYEYIHAYCVDNSLCKVADPTFVGYSIASGVDCGAKVVQKRDAHESVGVIALRDSKFSVVEYSEIPKNLAELVDDGTGKLAFNAANIANHFYTTKFLRDEIPKFEHKIAYHIARKKIPTVDLKTGSDVKPETPNGVKMELFIFDVFPFTNLAILEVERKDEFSPLKNAPGSKSDTPETSRSDVLSLSKRYLKENGANISDEIEIELSPLVTYAGEGLSFVSGKEVVKGGYVSSVDQLKSLLN
ncbi:nucleotide-diphospho-sugar transferase [Wallemia mellicola]|uniref:UDP-N-acetylglucosamine diphosphorylase n=1 Tax=Wallemia mellicola TaxID=1708541 RepID=A0A4T0MTH2_9BASI|nr:hypothetical protein E3Q23_01298 [Wallemia mellicola]TIB86901.1 nucleotide-diphospho-sugar transferase [Wallemia mellicola]TIB89753.1 nucleotide-diphospho-sugar transferase [Wallemia mellicola]TIB92818.1 nucleotide-diphospho-sugar transferase [Wallemia mellicola]TIB99216.1 nucleotide-diphospho-sugar transferase [Wallemia mellicola]